jgi:hypothetical protein
MSQMVHDRTSEAKMLLAQRVGHAEQSLDSVNPCKYPSLSLSEDREATMAGSLDFAHIDARARSLQSP